MKPVTAIIVAGGQGTRLRPLTNTIPKPMIEVAGQPLLLHTLNLFKKHGVKDFIFALCYLPEVIIDHFGDGSRFGVTIRYTFEDPTTPLGTAGAIFGARNHITDTFIVTYADVLRDLDITKMLTQHASSKSFATLNTYPHRGSNYKSFVEFDNDHTLMNFTELPTSTSLPEGQSVWSNGSFYIFEPEIFDYIKKGEATDFTRHIFPKILRDNKKISVFPSETYFIDIGTLETLERAQEDIANKKFVP